MNDSGTHRSRFFKKNEFLFEMGEQSRDLYIIKSGKVRIFKKEGPLDVELDIANPGMVVGEISSIDGGTRTAFGQALEDTETVVITGQEFDKILNDVPDWFKKIATILVQRLRDVDEKLNHSQISNPVQLVASLITLMAKSNKCTKADDGSVIIERKFLENELVDLLALPIPEVTRIVDAFGQTEGITVDKSQFVLRDQDVLWNLAKDILPTPQWLPDTSPVQ
jgi:CRP/FNR family transcriptional regulator